MTETHNEFHDAQGSPIHTGAGDINPVYISFQESVKNQRSAGPRSTDKGNLE
jgi:hypothetical protein